MKNRFIKSALLSTVVLSGLSYNPVANAEDQLTLGLGGMVNSGIYIEVDTQVQPIPLAFGNVGSLVFKGESIGYDLFSSNGFYLLPIISFGLNQGFQESDIEDGSTFYDGYEERDLSIGAGVEVGYETSEYSLAFSAVSDISDTHSGYSLNFTAQKHFAVTDSLIISPQFSVKYNSEKLNQYYYGITESESNSVRPEYYTEGGVNYEVGVVAAWQATESWMLMTGVTYTMYDEDVTDSPIVDEEQEVMGFVGVGYNF